VEKTTALCVFAWEHGRRKGRKGPAGEERWTLWEGFTEGHCYFSGGIKTGPCPSPA